MFSWFKDLAQQLLNPLIVRPLTWAKSAVETVISWWWSLMKTWLGWLITAMIALATPLMQDLLALIKNVLVWVINFWWTEFEAAGAYLLSQIPTKVQPDISSVINFLNAANEWAPLDLAVTLAVSVVAFWLLALGYRAVKSWIPFVSG